jgi:AcrR family transcriptional regulator
MLKEASLSREERVPLSRERVLRAAMVVADTAGVRALTIRSLAAELGVTPMSVYYYVANKSEILDGIVDVVFSEIDLPPAYGDWRSEIARVRGIGHEATWSVGR